MAGFSPALLQKDEARNPAALTRIALAKRRIQSILDREIVAHRRTLEQKIADQGPSHQRVDPHLVGHAIFDLLELKRLKEHLHTATAVQPWYANPGTPDQSVADRLHNLAPLYANITGGGFGNLTGDALEIIVGKCLEQVYTNDRKYAYLGHFHLNEPKNAHGRYRKTQPPRGVGPHHTSKEADFLQFGHAAGPLCIECKNYRAWLYPNDGIIRDLIIKADDLHAMPLLVYRRLHYTTVTNLLAPAGIIAHESYFQYFPAAQTKLAEEAKHKRSLGFTDILASETPHPRTVKFFTTILPRIVDIMANRWRANRSALVDYAAGEINLAQLYTAIDSPAGGKWQNFDDPNRVPYDEY